MNIMFLDIDGVFNSRGSWIGVGDCYPHAFDNGLPVHFSNIAIGLAKDLYKRADMKVYMHSSWVYGKKEEWFERLFKTAGWEIEVLKFVPRKLSEERYHRIKWALDEYKPDNYIVLDDVEMKEFGEHMITTDAAHGFSYYDYAKACKVLGLKCPMVML